MRANFPKLSALMDEAEHDVLAFMTFPKAPWAQIYSTDPLERPNAVVKRRTDVVPQQCGHRATRGRHDDGAMRRVEFEPQVHAA